MSETRSYANKRQLVDYNNVIAKSGQISIICVDSGTLSILRQLVRSRGLWRSTYAVTRDDQLYTIPDATQFSTIERLIAEFLDETNDMATCTDLQTTLETLTDAVSRIGGNNCGCGSFGATGEADTTIDVGPPGEQSGSPPDGFSTWAEYEEYKCDVATYIVQKLANDWSVLRNFEATNLLASTVAAAIITPIIGDEIVIIVGIMVALALQAALADSLDDLIGIVTDHYTELVCALYEGATVSEARDAFVAIMDAEIDNDVPVGFRTVLKGLYPYWLSSDSLNRLFVRDPALADGQLLPTGNCAACDNCPEDVYVLWGTFDGVDTFDSESYQDASYDKERVDTYFESDPGGGYCGGVTISNINVTGGPLLDAGPGPTRLWRYWNSAGTLQYEGATEPSWPISNIGRLAVTSTNDIGSPPNAYSLEITWTVD